MGLRETVRPWPADHRPCHSPTSGDGGGTAVSGPRGPLPVGRPLDDPRRGGPARVAKPTGWTGRLGEKMYPCT